MRAENAIEQWERDHAEECSALRKQAMRDLATTIGGGPDSGPILRVLGWVRYRHLVPQGI